MIESIFLLTVLYVFAGVCTMSYYHDKKKVCDDYALTGVFILWPIFAFVPCLRLTLKIFMLTIAGIYSLRLTPFVIVKVIRRSGQVFIRELKQSDPVL